MPTDPHRLKEFACFSGLTENQRQEIGALASEVSFRSGHTLFEEGDPGSELYMLAAGQVEVLYSVGETGSTRVDTVGESEVLGCSSLIEPYLYSATAHCVSDVDVLVLDASELRKLMVKDCPVGYAIQNQIIRTLLDRIVDLRLGI